MSEKKEKEMSRDPEIVDSVPLVPFKVIDTDIPFFRDKDCQEMVEDARLIILQALDPDDEILEWELAPTTREYKKGDYVTMDLDSKKLWEESWYRDPRSGKIERAWRIHVNFIGNRISESALEKDRTRLADLEKRLEQRMSQTTSTVQ